jgi:hypothetical protein
MKTHIADCPSTMESLSQHRARTAVPVPMLFIWAMLMLLAALQIATGYRTQRGVGTVTRRRGGA